MRSKKWETLVAPQSKKNAPCGVRRIEVAGGWLYQVEHHVEVDEDHPDRITWVEWQPPVFVPFGGDGHGDA